MFEEGDHGAGYIQALGILQSNKHDLPTDSIE
jgi:hypothetical protein